MKTTRSTLLALGAVLFLSACGGIQETRITEGTEDVRTGPVGRNFATKDASIVHVDLSSRLATIRNGNKFEAGAFLITTDRTGRRTGVLKALPNRPIGLRTADVLEGEPEINNKVSPASASEAAGFAKIYRDPEE